MIPWKSHLSWRPAIPSASEPDSFLVVIEFDMAEYQRKHNSKAVKKILSIPKRLNEEATAMGINFSQVLQEALIDKIQSRA